MITIRLTISIALTFAALFMMTLLRLPVHAQAGGIRRGVIISHAVEGATSPPMSSLPVSSAERRAVREPTSPSVVSHK
jgi:hypothetical protein